MKFEVVELSEKVVAGVSAITSNDDPKMTQVIGGLWGDFFSSCYEKINGKVNHKAIGLYCDYGIPNKNNYTVLVGAEVAKSAVNSFVTKVIPAGKYAKFTVYGEVSKVTAECWQEIWNEPLERTFSGDFEEYQEDCDGKTGTVHIYLAIK